MSRKLLSIASVTGLALIFLHASPLDAADPNCGNGTLQFEDCDPGPNVPGDCCTVTCSYEPVGAACDDGNVCTDDQCNAAGVCVGTDDDTNTCTDGDSCTPDACVSGVCESAGDLCGDGNLDSGCAEACDDGNLTDGDGCSASCEIEDGDTGGTTTGGTTTGGASTGTGTGTGTTTGGTADDDGGEGGGCSLIRP